MVKKMFTSNHHKQHKNNNLIHTSSKAPRRCRCDDTDFVSQTVAVHSRQVMCCGGVLNSKIMQDEDAIPITEKATISSWEAVSN